MQADIEILKNQWKTSISGLTQKGKDWVRKKLAARIGDTTTVVDTEHVPDIVDLIEGDGLTVLEK